MSIEANRALVLKFYRLMSNQKFDEMFELMFSFAPKDSGFKYSVYGKNLTNRAYIDGVTPNPVSAVSFYAPPREVGVSVDYSF